MSKSKVFFTKNISSEGLVKIYNKLNTELKGKVAVKISTGEPGGHNFLDFNLIKDLVHKLDGTIVECCTAYKGKRYEPREHWETMKLHGFMDIAPCDVLDEEGELKLPVNGGKHLKYNIVGKNIEKYNSILMLSHFKGHQMAGMGGALKNMSIGLASRNGKAWIHSYGNTSSPDKMWNYFDNQNAFLESMAEACESVISYVKPENIVYINVANNLSIDCDCNSHPSEPKMKDIGIYASLDPVALDQACYDAIINSSDEGKDTFVARMKERNAIHLLEEAARLNLGFRDYEIIDID